MRIRPQKNDFKVVVSIVTLPKRVVALVAKIAMHIWTLISKRRGVAPKLTNNQVKLINDIKHRKHAYQPPTRTIVPINPVNPVNPVNLVNPVNTVVVPREVVRQIVNLPNPPASPEPVETTLPPVLEEFRQTINVIATNASSVVYEDKIKPHVVKHQEGGIPTEVAEMINKVSAPVLTAATAILRKYKGKEADPSAVESAINELICYIDGVYRNDLSSLIERSVSNNASKITDILAVRALELLSEIPFGDIVDEMGLAICTHVDGLTTADAAVSSIIKRAKTPTNKKDSPDQIALLKKCHDEMTAQGEESYRSEKMLQAFIDTPACHQTVKDLTQMDDTDQEATYKEIYADLSNEIIDLMLPRRAIPTPGGPVVVEGLNYLWDNIEWPEEMGEIKDQIMDILEMILPESGFLGAEKTEKQITELLESSILSYIDENIRSILATKLQSIFQKFVSPQELRKQIALKLLPTVDNGILPMITKKYIVDQVDSTAPLFLNWIRNPQQATAIKEELINILYQTCQVNSTRFQLSSDPISKERFTEEIIPTIDDTFRILSTYRQEIGRSQVSLIGSLKKTFEPHITRACSKYINRVMFPDLQSQSCIRDMRIALDNRKDIDKNTKDLIKQVLDDRNSALRHDIKKQPESGEAICEDIIKCVGDRLTAYQLDVENIKAQLRALETDQKSTDSSAPPYGEMIVKTLFNIGDLEIGTEMGKASFFIDAIAKAPVVQDVIREVVQTKVLGVLKPLRDGYEVPVTLLTEMFQKFQDKESIRATLERLENDDEEEDLDVTEVDNVLNEEVMKVSLAVHDLLEATVQTKVGFGEFGKKITKKMIFPNTEKIQHVIKNCINKMTCNELINTSLALTMQDIFVVATQEANQKARDTTLGRKRIQRAA